MNNDEIMTAVLKMDESKLDLDKVHILLYITLYVIEAAGVCIVLAHIIVNLCAVCCEHHVLHSFCIISM
jgi:hypothetical protein